MLSVRLIIPVLDKFCIVDEADLPAHTQFTQSFIVLRYIGKSRFFINRLLLDREHRIHKHIRIRKFPFDLIQQICVLFNEQIDIPALFRESFGIWNNPNDPVEEVVLRYDALDGAFIKTLPLHATQEILEEKPDTLTIRLHVRITNDFVMALLARSRSLEVIRPASLRKRIYDTCLGAAGRNKPAEDEQRAILE